MIPALQLANECMQRGIPFLPVDLYKSESSAFVPCEEGIRMPFNALPNLGDAAAIKLVDAAKQGKIMSVEDLADKSHVSKAIIEILRENGILKGLSETNQLTFMDEFTSQPKKKKKTESVSVEKQSFDAFSTNNDAETIGENDQISLF